MCFDTTCEPEWPALFFEARILAICKPNSVKGA